MWPHPRRTEPLKGAIADARRTRKMVRTTLSAKVMPAISLSLTPERSGSKAAPSVFAAARICPALNSYCPRPAALAKRLASSATPNNAFALLMHSCCSKPSRRADHR